MAQQLVNIGSAPDDGTGDPARTAFDKLNDNDAELYKGLIQSSTWAARGSGSTVGELKRITDIGPTGGSIMMWDGTYWKLLAPTNIVVDTTLVTGIADTNEQLLKTGTLPAGILRAGRSFAVRALLGKNGTNNSATANRIRLGSAGTTADASLIAPNGMSQAQVTLPLEVVCFPTSATNIRRLSSQLNTTAAWTNVGNAGTYPVDVTVADLDANALIVSACVQMAGATDQGQVAHLILELRP